MFCVSLSYVYINELHIPSHNALCFIELCANSYSVNDLICITGSVAQLLDSLDEVQILSHAKKNDIDFLHHFLDNNKLQSLLEVRLYNNFIESQYG